MCVNEKENKTDKSMGGRLKGFWSQVTFWERAIGMGKKKEARPYGDMLTAGIEPATFALLARRSTD